MRRLRNSQGFTLVELLIVVAIIGLLAAMAVPNLREAMRRARTKALVADGRTLRTAFAAYNADHDEYPPCCTPASEALDTTSLHPLTRDGYLKDGVGITGKLEAGKLSLYDSPDQPTSNHDFYAVLTHARDPTLVVLVADTDEYPGAPGDHLDGVYVVRGTAILEADDS